MLTCITLNTSCHNNLTCFRCVMRSKGSWSLWRKCPIESSVLLFTIWMWGLCTPTSSSPTDYRYNTVLSLYWCLSCSFHCNDILRQLLVCSLQLYMNTVSKIIFLSINFFFFALSPLPWWTRRPVPPVILINLVQTVSARCHGSGEERSVSDLNFLHLWGDV